MNELQIFKKQEFGQIRTIVIDGEPWFVGKDVATSLGYAKPENAIANHVDDDDKTSTLIQGSGSNYKSKAIIINESGHPHQAGTAAQGRNSGAEERRIGSSRVQTDTWRAETESRLYRPHPCQ